MDCYTRRAELVRILKEGGRVSTAMLMERFGVSDTTIKNDMWYLRRRIPIKTVSGRYGGYEYAGEQTVEFTEKEALALCGVLAKHPDETDPALYASGMEKCRRIRRP